MRLTLKRFVMATLLLFAAASLNAATPNTSLTNLAAELDALETQLSAVQISPDDVCAPLLQANEAVRSAADAVTAVDENLAAPLQVDAATYDALDALFGTGLALSNEALRPGTPSTRFSARGSPSRTRRCGSRWMCSSLKAPHPR
ncbi:MAG: hypothetical protein P8Y65_06645 [Campylobacterales bacterium]